jgi:RNA-directed DNA polymerase
VVKAFLKAGVLTTLGTTEGMITGTPQGGILSPLLANIALSVLDDEFTRRWTQEMGRANQRNRRRYHGEATYRLIRYADDFVIVVKGERADAEQLREEVAAVLAPMGLRLSPLIVCRCSARSRSFRAWENAAIRASPRWAADVGVG